MNSADLEFPMQILRVLLSTKYVAYSVFVFASMGANAVYGAPRMGPIFGGMLLSGKRAAELILKKL